MKTMEEVAEMLSKHDFYYEYSDDHSYWNKGHEDKQKIMKVLAELDPLQALTLLNNHVPKGLYARYYIDYRSAVDKKGVTLP